MGFRFRKSVRLLPGLRVNFSRSGASLSAGVRGASVTFGRRGTYANVGIPGTGMSYRTKVVGPAYRAPTTATSTVPVPRTGPSLRGWVGIAAALLFGGYLFFGSGERVSDRQNALVGKDAERLSAPETEMPSPAITAPAISAPTAPSSPETTAALPIGRDRIAALQQALSQLGLNPGPADGIAGSQTITAVKLFQLSKGRQATGVIDGLLVDDVIAELRAQTGSAQR